MFFLSLLCSLLFLAKHARVVRHTQRHSHVVLLAFYVVGLGQAERGLTGTESYSKRGLRCLFPLPTFCRESHSHDTYVCLTPQILCFPFVFVDPAEKRDSKRTRSGGKQKTLNQMNIFSLPPFV